MEWNAAFSARPGTTDVRRDVKHVGEGSVEVTNLKVSLDLEDLEVCLCKR